MTNPWDAAAYDRDFAFVTVLGRELLDELGVAPGDRVLDVGCGSGHLAAELARRGATTVGLDADPRMLEQARAVYPDLVWIAGDAQRIGDLELPAVPFDAVISNAALHWMHRQADVLTGIRSVVRDGARFVAEMGGAGNVAAADAAFRAALAESEVAVDPGANYFPTVGEQAALLEQSGFRVDSIRWFERPTPLAADQTLVDWLRHFRAAAWAAIPVERTQLVADRVLVEGDRRGLVTDGAWHVDYCRLRFRVTAVATR